MMIRIFSVALLSLVASAQTPAVKKLEAYLLLPEPSALRSEISQPLGGGRKTVVTPAKETSEAPGLKHYTKEEFNRLGISLETFAERARAAADARLKTIMPEFIKDEKGKTRYAVFRSESSLIASLISAPSLASLFTKTFAGDVWAVLPDRHSLYIFPADPELLAEFTDDLAQRYRSDPYAASCEVFLIKPGEAPKAVATFSD